MVAGRDEPEPPPQKKGGIDLVMFPLNPDGSWKNGLAPPKLTSKPAVRMRERRHRLDEEIFPRLRSMTNQLKNIRVNLARDSLRKITIRRIAGEELPRLELSTVRDGSPSLVIEPAEDNDDLDSSDDIIFLQDAQLDD